MHLHDVRMFELPERSALGSEAEHDVLARLVFRSQHLQRELGAQRQMLDQVDLTHAALAEEIIDAKLTSNDVPWLTNQTSPIGALGVGRVRWGSGNRRRSAWLCLLTRCPVHLFLTS